MTYLSLVGGIYFLVAVFGALHKRPGKYLPRIEFNRHRFEEIAISAVYFGVDALHRVPAHSLV